MAPESKIPKNIPKMRKGFAAFLSNEDAAISNKSLLGISAL